MGKKLTNEQFIEKAEKIHGKKYLYPDKYIGTDTKINIVCSEHGIFEQTPHCHLQGQGCPVCSGNIKLTNESFIKKAIEIHSGLYDYSLVEYKSNKIKVKIICKIHDIFQVRPDAHIYQKQGCKKCGVIQRTSRQDDVIKKFNKIHNYEYDYSLVEYKNTYTDVKIICTKHGIFEQPPHLHLRGQGCPICNESKGEKNIRKYLIKNNIIFIRQKRFDNCKDKIKLPFDFYLPDYNTCIEFDGEQHFKSVEYWGGEKRLKDTQNKDHIKSTYCKKNNIKLLRIKYTENIQEKLLFL